MRGLSEDVRKLLIQLIRRKIAIRAYQLYEERGRQHGRDLDDWLLAEAEILGTPHKTAAASPPPVYSSW